MLALTHARWFERQQKFQLLRGNVLTRYQHLTELALVFHQRTAAGIRMLGVEPDERLSAKRRCEKSIIRAHSGEAVDPGSPQHANGNSERELCAVNAAAQAGADGHVKKLQSQRARKNVPQPCGPGELRQPPRCVRLITPEPGEHAVDKQDVRERSD